MKNAMWFFVGVVLAFWIGIATAASKIYSQEEAEANCLFSAQSYEMVARARDQGYEALDLHAMIALKQADGEINSEEEEAWHSVVEYVYQYPHLSPEKLGESVYKQCMADLMQKKI